MKLEKFKRNNNKITIAFVIIAITVINLLCDIFVYYKSHAYYYENKTFNVIRGKVPYFSSGNIIISYTVDGEKSSTFPEKSNKYSVKVDCKDTATGKWNTSKWLVEISNATAETVKCNILFTTKATYSENLLNGADPVLAGDLIPVTISEATEDSDGGVVTYADISQEWYNYENKEWANAVILVANPSQDYSVGDTISEDDIESYFVWIPKYSYEIFNMGTYTGLSSEVTSAEKTIKIKFGTDNTTDTDSECATPLTSGASGNCAVGLYMTHPAFVNSGTNGIWVGKFETGYKGATSTAEAQITANDSTSIIVKPNTYSWRNNTIYNFFMSAYNYRRETLDSHMMKNTEWGAVAYLSYSDYGINSNVYINNNSNFVTGCVGTSADASSVSSCANTWNSYDGKKGSTTGNISGVYDMSGGAWEYMAAYNSGTGGDSGFTTTQLTTYAKYLDVYNNDSSYTTYNRRILGDATGEMGPFANVSGFYLSSWYADYAYFAYSSSPWFRRGGHNGITTLAGQFSFHYHTGAVFAHNGSRLILDA